MADTDADADADTQTPKWASLARRVLAQDRSERILAAKGAVILNVSFRAAEARLREDGASDEFFRHTKHWGVKIGILPPGADARETKRVLTQKLYELYSVWWNSFKE